MGANPRHQAQSAPKSLNQTLYPTEAMLEGEHAVETSTCRETYLGQPSRACIDIIVQIGLTPDRALGQQGNARRAEGEPYSACPPCLSSDGSSECRATVH